MSLTKKVTQTSETKLNTSSKTTTLNPHAAEFIPFCLRSPLSGRTSTSNPAARVAASSSTVGKAVLDRSASSASRNSDEEAHQYWHHQLPDDITPDFEALTEDDPQLYGSLSLAGLSLHDTNETSRFPASTADGYAFPGQPDLLSLHIKGNNLSGKIRYSTSSYGIDAAQTNILHLAPKPWERQIMNGDQLPGNGKDGHPRSGNSRHELMNDMIGEVATVGDVDVSPVEFLASRFPGFAAESLAEVFFASGCDLRLTIEMLAQLELQADGDLNQNPISKALPASNLSTLDCHALTVADTQNIPTKYASDDFQQTANLFRSAEKDNMLLFKSSSAVPSRGSIDFATAVSKLASQDSGMWKYERNGSVDSTVGSSRGLHGLAGACSSDHGRNIYAEKLQNRGSSLSAPVWVETGDAVSNMYSEIREDACDHDHALLHNVHFEQARQAYLIGNKALVKELSVEGQLHNMHMKMAHEKAQEAIYHQWNPVGPGHVRGNERMINLQGLNVSEAIQILKRKLSVLRSTPRVGHQRLQVYICVGTGRHHATPSRLPIAVQRYLLEDEGLNCNEPQPGLLRVVIH